MTIEESRVEKFPFKVGDRVQVNWYVKEARKLEYGTVSYLSTSTQSGYEVVHAMYVRIDGKKTDTVVNAEICKKIDGVQSEINF